MRKTRHILLPVKSWQYIGLLVVSLACLTLGLVSRDREGRHGSLAGPELKHTAPHEVDACPNDNFVSRLLNADSSSTLTDIPKLPHALKSHDPTTKLPSLRIDRDSRLAPKRRQTDVTRLLPSRRSQVTEERSAIKSMRRNRYLERTDDARLERSRLIQAARNTRTGEVRRIRASGVRRVVVEKNRDQRSRSNQQIDDGRVRMFENRHDVQTAFGLTSRFVDKQRAEHRVRVAGNQLARDQRDSRFNRQSVDSSRVSSIRDNRVDNRVESRAARRSLSSERRVRDKSDSRWDSRSERKLLSTERRIQNHRNDVRAERQITIEHQLANQERQARLEENRRIRESKQRISFARSRLTEQQRTRDFSSVERLTRDFEKQERNRVARNERAHQDPRFSREQRHRQSRERQVERLVRSDDQRTRRSVDDSRARQNRREITRLNNQRARSLENVRAREIRTRIENRENRERESRERRDFGRSENHRVASRHIETSAIRTRDSRLARNVGAAGQTEKLGQAKRSNLMTETRSGARNPERRVVESERRNILTAEKVSGSILQKVRYTANQLPTATIRENRLDQLNEKKLDYARRIDSVRNIRVKKFTDSKYLKNSIPADYLNYEVLRQAIVIGLCAIYGASFFKNKTSFIGNLGQYSSRLLTIW